MLAAAGFHMRRADTPERQEALRSMPPYQIVSKTQDGNIVYTYADPDHCRCLYIGGHEEYSRYERIRAGGRTLSARQGVPEARPSTTHNTKGLSACS
jgi:hypothetical protein